MAPRPLRIGVTCFPTLGGSGVIAAEIGLGLGRRGHDVHFICYGEPGRLHESPGAPGVRFHRVEVPAYPLPHLSPYPLTLASTLFEVARRERLDLLHVHYALPHATSAHLAREMARAEGLALRVVTTVHGTDVTLLGPQAPLRPVVRFSLLSSDALTAPSRYLREAAIAGLGLPPGTPIEVIPNFVDPERFCPRPGGGRGEGGPVLVHGSNFRPLKRVGDAVRVLAALRRALPARLLLVGDGPDARAAAALAEELGVSDAVELLGEQADVAEVLRRGDLFLLPSESEGFGLAALEAQSCGLPVVGSRVGGVPEVVVDGETGLLCDVGDVEGMAAAALRILGDEALRGAMARAARARALRRFQREPMMARYEACYRRVLGS